MRKIAFIFPGQGSQYVGMGQGLYKAYEVAKRTFEEADEALGYHLSDMCFHGPADELQKTEFTQPAILTHSIAAYRVFEQEFGLRPHFLAGHSLGEITALVCAGAIPFADAVGIVQKRGLFMQQAVPVGVGTMSAISDLDPLTVEEVCHELDTPEERVTVSNYNTPRQTVIAGHVTAIERAEQRLRSMGGSVVRLKVSAPFHCPLMKEAAFQLEHELLDHQYADLSTPVIANVNALPYLGAKNIVEKLTVQMTRPIQWNQTMHFLKNQGVNVVIELGPGVVLRNMMRKTFADVHSFSFDKDEDIANMNELFDSGVLAYPCLISRSLAIAVCTRNSTWDVDAYQSGVVEPYRRIQTMLQEIEQNGLEPTLEQKRAALDMLLSVFRTKGTPIEEQKERFRQLFEETNSRHLFPDFDITSELVIR
ncbi:ACP S-malonyltransferase [Brevibacillus brevis]|uniref:ACP S-malonyltransferase n=1 Tax=Brevibacillus brevis TaxID=1393 RepID=UPI000D0FC207|nr:ACP S-malonyltransferase [Brevibacillus brevis]PSJ63212.1 [acyl-carrier-protein] S-malonyltransferase [Brevibacillus brevis]RED35855.1 [acyl-carrier-protein] S-malonyltransferase [Brevibacillus brevis]GEC93045.1 hypothetical protein BBR01nite_53760 [Brevibacillus brevis]VEF89036.1 Malonyl CoA-acyl carrier protein transacylase [Brevibacillus brevis]